MYEIMFSYETFGNSSLLRWKNGTLCLNNSRQIQLWYDTATCIPVSSSSSYYQTLTPCTYFILCIWWKMRIGTIEGRGQRKINISLNFKFNGLSSPPPIMRHDLFLFHDDDPSNWITERIENDGCDDNQKKAKSTLLIHVFTLHISFERSLRTLRGKR